MENEEMKAQIEADMKDRCYVQSLEEECNMLRAQVSYLQVLCYDEFIKSQMLIDTFKKLKLVKL